MITVLLVDDHAHVLKSLTYFLEVIDDIQVVATASNGREAVTQASSHYPNVVIMDYFTSHPAGQITRYCKRDFMTS